VELAIPLDTVSVCANADPLPLPEMPLLGFWASTHPDSPSPQYVDKLFDPSQYPTGDQAVYYRAQTSGCIDSFIVRILPAPQGQVFTNNQLLTGDTLYLQFPATYVNHVARYAFADSFAWFLGQLGSTPVATDTAWAHRYLQNGVYRLELQTANRFSCTDNRVVWVAVRDSTGMELPTAFSPNNDGLNDAFEIKALNLLWHEVTIFSRWAGAIHTYRADGGYSSWDGRLSDGSPVPEGTYGCRVTALKHDGRKLEWAGFIHVLR
jgi:gliding motility-associated-like protein